MLIAEFGRSLRAILFAAAAAGGLTAATQAPAQETPPGEAQGEQTPAEQEPAAQPQGGTTAADIEPKQIQLTPKLVESFIAAWPEFEALREKLAAANPSTKAQDNNPGGQPESDEAEIGESEDPIGALAAYLDKPEAKAEIDAVLKKHDFANYSDWADAAQSVLLAFGASDPEGGDTDLAAEKQKGQTEIQHDAALSDEEKQAALKDLDEQFAALESFQPLPGNVEAVKPYLDRIKALFGEDEN